MNPSIFRQFGNISTAAPITFHRHWSPLPWVVELHKKRYYKRDTIHSFIHSGHFYSAPSSPLLLRGAPDYCTDTVSEFHAEAHRQLQVKDLPKGPYMAARAGVEPTTFRLRVNASTNAPPCPTNNINNISTTISTIKWISEITLLIHWIGRQMPE